MHDILIAVLIVVLSPATAHSRAAGGYRVLRFPSPLLALVRMIQKEKP